MKKLIVLICVLFTVSCNDLEYCNCIKETYNINNDTLELYKSEYVDCTDEIEVWGNDELIIVKCY